MSSKIKKRWRAEHRIDARTIITVCNGCGRELTHKPDAVLTSAPEVLAWLKDHLRPCICGAKTCDIRIPVVPADPESLETKKRGE